MKKFLAFLLAALCILPLAACNQENPPVSTGGDATIAPDRSPEPSESKPLPSDPTVLPTKTPDTTPTPTPTPTPPPPVVETEEVPTNRVRHLFSHCLIDNPKKGCGAAYGPLDADCLTVKEFVGMLESLYKNNFVLIDINDMFTVDANGKASLTPTVTVPKGKKPLVISIDDVVYDDRKLDYGMVHRLVIENDTIMGCYDHKDGSVTLSDGDVFPQLEKFLKLHPDFSYNGAKVTLALTGFAGILGYRTDDCYIGKSDRYGNKYDIEKEKEKAMVVVNWLKEHGYTFACHSYSHANYQTCSARLVKSDMEQWNRMVKPLIGETNIFVYPYGAHTLYGSESHTILLNEGFVMFCGTSQLNTIWDNKQPKLGGGVATGTGTIYLERFTVTGFTLRNYGSEKTYFEYYYNYYLKTGLSEEEAKEKANKRLAHPVSGYHVSRERMLEYFVPEEIYDHENRFLKIL